MIPGFWDSSSLFALCCFEPATVVAEALADDYSIVVWWATHVEVRGGIARRSRAGGISTVVKEEALLRLRLLNSNWLEIQPSLSLRGRALELAAKHELRAADALQLAAAMEWRAGTYDAMNDFITGDGRLLIAAQSEGFLVHSTA